MFIWSGLSKGIIKSKIKKEVRYQNLKKPIANKYKNYVSGTGNPNKRYKVLLLQVHI